MAFINEFISPEDVARYDLEEIDKKFIVGGTDARDWTIDRDATSTTICPKTPALTTHSERPVK